MRHGYGDMKVAKIEKITPTGIVRVEDWPATFDRGGCERGGSSSYSRDSLAVCTPELRKKASVKRFAEKIGSLLFRANLEKDYTPTQLEAVYRILSNPNNETEQA